MIKYSCKAPGMFLDYRHRANIPLADLAATISLTPDNFSSFIFGGATISEEQKNTLEQALDIPKHESGLMFSER